MTRRKKQQSSKLKKKMQCLKKLIKLVKGYIAAVHKLNKNTFTKMKKIILTTAIAVFIAISFAACNATRTITTTQTHIKGQDTVVTMTTQTKETYDATVKPKNMF